MGVHSRPIQYHDRPSGDLRREGKIGTEASYGRTQYATQLKAAGFDLADPKIKTVLDDYENDLLDQEHGAYERINNRTAAREGMALDNGQTVSPLNTPSDQREFVESLAHNTNENPDSTIRGVTDRISRLAYVRTDGSNAESGGVTVVHEAVHQYSHARVGELPRFLEEGMTEYFARKTLRDSGIRYKDGGMNYFLERQYAFQLGAIVGDSAMESAYFKGDIEGLKSAFEARAGEGSWDRFMIIMEKGKQNGHYAGEIRETSEKLDAFIKSNPGIRQDAAQGYENYLSIDGSYFDGQPLGVDDTL